MKTTAMTAEERVRYMTQAPVRRLILEMSAPTLIPVSYTHLTLPTICSV